MISHLCCIRIPTKYTKWSRISQPYLLCTKQKGVQALRLRLGKWMAPLSSLISYTPPSQGQKLRPTRIREIKMKKKLKMMVMLLCATALWGVSSCTKDSNDKEEDNDPNGYKELIIGKWRCIYDRDGGSSSIGTHWEFFSNGTMKTDDREDIMYGKTVDYKINGNTLSLLGGALSYTIDKLTSEDLVLSGMNYLKFTKRAGSGTNKSASNNIYGDWSSSYELASKAHCSMFYDEKK